MTRSWLKPQLEGQFNLHGRHACMPPDIHHVYLVALHAYPAHLSANVLHHIFLAFMPTHTQFTLYEAHDGQQYGGDNAGLMVGGQAADQDGWDGDGEDAEEHGDSSAIHVTHMPKAAPRTATIPAQ